jgi:hypothetical protein
MTGEGTLQLGYEWARATAPRSGISGNRDAPNAAHLRSARELAGPPIERAAIVPAAAVRLRARRCRHRDHV